MNAHSDTIATLQKNKTYSAAIADAERKNVMLQMLNNELRKEKRAQAKRIKNLEKAIIGLKETINEHLATIRAENSKEVTK